MKIKKTMLTALIATTIITGCGNTENKNTQSPISTKQDDNGDYIIAEIGSETLLANSLFETLKENSSAGQVLYNLIRQEAINQYFPITDSMRKSADIYMDTLLQNYRSQYGATAEQALLADIQGTGSNSFEEYKEQLINHFQMTEFTESFTKNNYDQVFDLFFENDQPRMVSHIIITISDPENPTSEETAKIAEVRAALDSGQDFAAVAREFSEDGSAAEGGSLGLVTKNTQFVEEFLTAALEAEEGVMTTVESQFGYHFILVTASSREAMLENAEYREQVLANQPAFEPLAFKNLDITYANDEIRQLVEDYLDSILEMIKSGG